MFYQKSETFTKNGKTISVNYLCIKIDNQEYKLGYIDNFGRVHLYTLK